MKWCASWLMMAHYTAYQFLAVLLVCALGFALAPLVLARLWARKWSLRKPGPEKNAVFECGLVSRGDARIRFKSEYFRYGIIFLIFDVEAVFLLPFAVVFGELPAGAVLAMAFFLLLLLEGLVWAWHRGVLTWR